MLDFCNSRIVHLFAFIMIDHTSKTFLLLPGVRDRRGVRWAL